jgi:hypothetical protein
MFPKLIPVLVLLPALPVSSAQNRGVAPAPIPGISLPSIKMGLWEETTTIANAPTIKSRSCVTQQSYQMTFGKMPSGCTISNPNQTSSSIETDIACTMNGVSTSGHLSVQIADSGTVHTTMTYTAQVQGRPMQGTITTESMWVGSSCGDIAPGESRDVD